MANINAANTGNWSNSATWPGGTFPGPGDVVHANGKTVTIDQDITVASLNTSLLSGGVAGGSFILNTTRTINANVNAGTTTCVTASAAAGIFVINGIVTGGTSNNAFGVLFSSTGTLTINGDVVSGNVNASVQGVSQTGALSTLNINGDLISSVVASTNYALTTSSTGSTHLVGDVIGAGGRSMLFSSTGTFTMTGDVFGDLAVGLYFNNGSSTVVINGDIFGGATGTGAFPAVQIDNAASVTINGKATGGIGGNKIAVKVNGAAGSTVTINGDVEGGGVGSSGLDLATSSPAVVTVNGALISSSAYGAVSTTLPTSPAILKAKGPFVSVGHVFPFNTNFFELIRTTAAENYLDVLDSVAATLVRLSTPDAITDMPDEADVRLGVIFAGSDVGTLAVPDPSEVSVGVSTDDTVGTAALTPEDVWDHPRTSATASGSMGERLKNTATVDTTGDQIAQI